MTPTEMNFFSEDTDFEAGRQDALREWVGRVIAQEGRIAGAVNFIFCSDEYLLRMNIDHLGHDFYTDIITFDYCDGPVVSGDLFISVDRVRENAAGLNIPFDDELHRVMIHGILHLLGLKDKSEEDERMMRLREDECLRLLAGM